MEKHDWYDAPLYYDIVFDQGTKEEAEFLEAMHRRHGTGSVTKGLTQDRAHFPWKKLYSYGLDLPLEAEAEA